MLGMQTHDDLVAIQGNPPYQGCPALDVAQTGFTCEACCWFFNPSRSPWFLPLPCASPLVSFPPVLPRAWRPRCDSCLGLQKCCDCLGVGSGEPSPWNPPSPQCSPGGTSCPIWSHSQLHRYRLEARRREELAQGPHMLAIPAGKHFVSDQGQFAGQVKMRYRWHRSRNTQKQPMQPQFWKDTGLLETRDFLFGI